MGIRAGAVMTDKVIRIGWNAPLAGAFELMQQHRLRHLPVLDDDGDVIGILSDRDLQRAMRSELEWNATLGAKIPSFESVQFDPDAKVRHYMSWPVKTVGAKSDLREVAGMMVVDKISSVLICDGDRTMGILTTEDLLKVLMGLLDKPQLHKRMVAQDVLRAPEVIQ